MKGGETVARSTTGEQPCPSAVSDAELLERFVTSRDEAAFAALMARHGPMVFGLCRRMLAHAQDAEDAFQATFLILVRKASAIGRRELLGNWLYGVAARVAGRARRMAAMRQTREAADMERIATAMCETKEATDLSAAVAEEVQRLPAKYRRPVVQYYLQGRTTEEVAGELRCPVGTIKTRLSRAREMLRKRLTRRGLALSTAALSTTLLAEAPAASLSPVLIGSTLKAASHFAAGDAAAGGFVSAQAAALTKGVLHTMFVTKLKIVAALGLALAMIVGGVGAFAYHHLAESEADNKDKENIQGTWKAISVKVNGKTDDPESNMIKKMEIFITADKIGFRLGDRSKETPYKIDTKANPKTLDSDLGEGLTELGIYKLERDTLTICYCNANKKERPKAFESKEGTGTILMVLKRVK